MAKGSFPLPNYPATLSVSFQMCKDMSVERTSWDSRNYSSHQQEEHVSTSSSTSDYSIETAFSTILLNKNWAYKRFTTGWNLPNRPKFYVTRSYKRTGKSRFKLFDNNSSELSPSVLLSYFSLPRRRVCYSWVTNDIPSR